VYSPERWAEEALGCPGMGRGPLHAAEQIERALEDDGTAGQGGGAAAQRGAAERSAGPREQGGGAAAQRGAAERSAGPQ